MSEPGPEPERREPHNVLPDRDLDEPGSGEGGPERDGAGRLCFSALWEHLFKHQDGPTESFQKPEPDEGAIFEWHGDETTSPVVGIIQDPSSREAISKLLSQIEKTHILAPGPTLPEMAAANPQMVMLDDAWKSDVPRIREQHGGVHVLLITSNGEMEFERKATQLGFDDFIVRPISEQQLSRRLGLTPCSAEQQSKPKRRPRARQTDFIQEAEELLATHGESNVPLRTFARTQNMSRSTLENFFRLARLERRTKQLIQESIGFFQKSWLTESGALKLDREELFGLCKRIIEIQRLGESSLSLQSVKELVSEFASTPRPNDQEPIT